MRYVKDCLIVVLSITTASFAYATFYYRNEWQSRGFDAQPIQKVETSGVPPRNANSVEYQKYTQLTPLAKNSYENVSSQPSPIELRADRKVAAVEEFAVLSEDEKDALKAQFMTRKDHSSQIVKEVLGEVRAEKVRTAQQQKNIKARDERVDAKLFKLVRKLTLTKEQEVAVRIILTNVEDEVSGLTQKVEITADEVTLEHENPDGNRALIREKYSEMKKMTEALKEAEKGALDRRLKDALTDEQYNLYLSAESE